MPKQVPVFQMLISEDNAKTGVSLISFVENPAIESNFVALSAACEMSAVEAVGLELAKDTHKQIVTGPVLIPDKNILRLSDKGEPYFIRFSAEVIEQIRDRFFQRKHTDKTNSEHAIPLEGNHVIESWTVADPANDKSAALGLSGLAAGAWVVSYKINDKDYWLSEIMSGKRKGFSLEGVFDMAPVSLMAYEPYLEKSKGYSRASMPQIETGMMKDFFLHFLRKFGQQSIRKESVQAKSLLPAQSEINPEKVSEKLASGTFAGREYIISRDGYLLDGHHDWAAALEKDPDLELTVLRVDLPIGQLVDEANNLKFTYNQKLSAMKKTGKKGYNKMHKAYNALKKAGLLLSLVPGGVDALDAMKEALSTTTLEDGTPIEIDEVTGEVFLLDGNGARTGAAPDGSHTLADGSTIQVAGGLLVADAELSNDNPAAPATPPAPAPVPVVPTPAPVADAQLAAALKQVADLTALVQKLAAAPASLTIEKDVDKAPEKPKTKAEQVWESALAMSKVNFVENK